jgi:hypothetical protein
MPLPISTKPFPLDRVSYFKARWKVRSRQLAVSILAFCVVFGFVAVGLGLVPVQVSALITPIVFVLIFAAEYLKFRTSIYRPKNPAIFAERTLTFSEKDLHQVTTSGIESRVPWALFKYAERQSSFIMLGVSAKEFLALPDGMFLSDADRDEVYELIAQSVKWRGRAPMAVQGSR